MEQSAPDSFALAQSARQADIECPQALPAENVTLWDEAVSSVFAVSHLINQTSSLALILYNVSEM